MSDIDTRRPVGLLYSEWKALCVSALRGSASGMGVRTARDLIAGSGASNLVRASRRTYSTTIDRATVGRTQYHRILDTLDAFDAWNNYKYARSYVQKQLHREYINACLDIIFRDSWDKEQAAAMAEAGVFRIDKKIAVAMPRRFGKSYSIGMLLAAILVGMRESGVTITVYSSGMRASILLLLIVKKFLHLVDLTDQVLEADNQETVVIRAVGGPERRLVSLPCPTGVCILLSLSISSFLGLSLSLDNDAHTHTHTIGSTKPQKIRWTS
jgi:hypothetical protein